jgi:hypothetical protein
MILPAKFSGIVLEKLEICLFEISKIPYFISFDLGSTILALLSNNKSLANPWQV